MAAAAFTVDWPSWEMRSDGKFGTVSAHRDSLTASGSR